MSEDHTHQQPLYVPVRDNACGFTLRLFRDRDGSRCAVAFTTQERLSFVLGSGQRRLPLAEDALRDLLRPLDVQCLVIDPDLVVPPVSWNPPPRPAGQAQSTADRTRSAALVGATGGPALPRS